jgi:ABC-type phosphate/phosphonate transport system ATPase subunit
LLASLLDLSLASKETIFIGRKEPLNYLMGSFGRSKSIAAVIGEEGIGKSALLYEFSKKLKEIDSQPFIGMGQDVREELTGFK